MQHPGTKCYPYLGFSSLPHVPTLLNLPPKTSTRLDNVMIIKGDVLGLPRPTLQWRGHNPPRLSSARVPLVERPPLLRCKAPGPSLSCLCPHHLMGCSAPWRSKLIISPCVPVQMVPVRRAWYCTSKATPSMGSSVTGIIAMLITFYHQYYQTYA